MSPTTGSKDASRTGPRMRGTSSTPRPRTRSGPATLRRFPSGAFSRQLYSDGPTHIIPLDLSDELGITDGPATSPALVAHFVRIRAGEHIATNPNANSQLYYAICGRGFSAVNGRLVQWEKGDFLTLPARSQATFYASSDAALYWVH